MGLKVAIKSPTHKGMLRTCTKGRSTTAVKLKVINMKYFSIVNSQATSYILLMHGQSQIDQGSSEILAIKLTRVCSMQYQILVKTLTTRVGLNICRCIRAV